MPAYLLFGLFIPGDMGVTNMTGLLCLFLRMPLLVPGKRCLEILHEEQGTSSMHFLYFFHSYVKICTPCHYVLSRSFVEHHKI